MNTWAYIILDFPLEKRGGRYSCSLRSSFSHFNPSYHMTWIQNSESFPVLDLHVMVLSKCKVPSNPGSAVLTSPCPLGCVMHDRLYKEVSKASCMWAESSKVGKHGNIAYCLLPLPSLIDSFKKLLITNLNIKNPHRPVCQPPWPSPLPVSSTRVVSWGQCSSTGESLAPWNCSSPWNPSLVVYVSGSRWTCNGLYLFIMLMAYGKLSLPQQSPGTFYSFFCPHPKGHVA